MNQTELNVILDEHDNWRNDVPGAAKPDFTNITFHNADFSNRMLAAADFTGSDFTGGNFTNTDLQYVTLGNHTNCNFTGANVSYADRGSAVLTGSNIDDAKDCIMLPDHIIGLPEGTHAACRSDGVWTVRTGHNVFTLESARNYCGDLEGVEVYIQALDWLEANHNVGQV